MRPQSHIIDFALQNQLGADEKNLLNVNNFFIDKKTKSIIISNIIF